MDDLSRLYKLWPKQTNLLTHRQQNLSQVKTGQNRLRKQNRDKLVDHLYSLRVSSPYFCCM